MDATVRVRRQWNDFREATYRLDDIGPTEWRQTSGGVGARSPYPGLYTWVSCDGAVGGEVAHSGTHGPCPHTIRVVINRKDNDAKVFDVLASRAGPKPVRPRSSSAR